MGHAGLYLYALLFPSREELAHAALRLAARRSPVQGASDHGTHEAIYLPDPDGNGIELAADRPRERWPRPLTYAGGYHLGFNVWRGEGVPPVPQGRVGLRHWTVVLEDPSEVAAVRERVLAVGIEAEEDERGFLVQDPWDIAVRFATHDGPSG